MLVWFMVSWNTTEELCNTMRLMAPEGKKKTKKNRVIILVWLSLSTFLIFLWRGYFLEDMSRRNCDMTKVFAPMFAMTWFDNVMECGTSKKPKTIIWKLTLISSNLCLGSVYTIDHEVGPWEVAFSHGPIWWSNFHGMISWKIDIQILGVPH